MDNAYEQMQIDVRRIGESSSQYAYRILKHNIMYLHLLPGQVINDSAMAEVLNISRTPIREAIFRLRDERLIDIYAKNKTTVSYIDHELIKESILIRASLESTVIRGLCGKLSVADRARFGENLKIQQLFAQDYSLGSRYFEFDNEFHKLLFESGNHDWVWCTMERSCTQVNRVRYINHIYLEDEENERKVIHRLYDDHCAIYRCIVDNTPEKVDEIIKKHTDIGVIIEKWMEPNSELRKYIINFD